MSHMSSLPYSKDRRTVPPHIAPSALLLGIKLSISNLKSISEYPDSLREAIYLLCALLQKGGHFRSNSLSTNFSFWSFTSSPLSHPTHPSTFFKFVNNESNIR